MRVSTLTFCREKGGGWSVPNLILRAFTSLILVFTEITENALNLTKRLTKLACKHCESKVLNYSNLKPLIFKYNNN